MHSGSSVGVHGYQGSPRELGNHARMRRSIRYTDDPNLKRVGRTMSYISDIRSRGLPPLFSIQTFLSYSNVVYSLSLSLSSASKPSDFPTSSYVRCPLPRDEKERNSLPGICVPPQKYGANAVKDYQGGVYLLRG